MAQQYTRTAIGLHWIMATLIVAAFGVGLIVGDMTFSPTALLYISYHKWLGVTVFLFAVIRVLWRATHPAPGLDPNISRIENWLAHVVHMLLYVLIFAVPLSGYFYSLAAGFPIVYLGIIPVPSLIGSHPEIADTLKEVHEVFVYGMAGLVGLHVAGALKHYVIDRDGTLARMLPFLKRSDS
ncbi:MAG: cytochrome b [Candidatus Saccharibacteria bacterium]|nr:cytochrome b [Moraxellaceae bacterium]